MKKVQDKFRVVAVSENTNSFGLHQFVAVARSGRAYKLHTGTIYKPTKGQDITINETITESGNILFNNVVGMGIEMPQIMDKAPKEVVAEIYAD